MKIMIGNIIRCLANEDLWMRTIIVDGMPMTSYSENKKELEVE